MMTIKRHTNEILIFDELGQKIVSISREEAVEIAQRILDLAGQMRDEPEQDNG